MHVHAKPGFTANILSIGTYLLPNQLEDKSVSILSLDIVLQEAEAGNCEARRRLAKVKVRYEQTERCQMVIGRLGEC